VPVVSAHFRFIFTVNVFYVVGRVNEVTLRRPRLVLGWVTDLRRARHVGIADHDIKQRQNVVKFTFAKAAGVGACASGFLMPSGIKTVASAYCEVNFRTPFD